MNEDAPDSKDLTPVESPDARRRRSSQSMRPPVKCPKCKGDARVECELCFNPTIGGCTRYVDEAKAIAWSMEHGDTDPEGLKP